MNSDILGLIIKINKLLALANKNKEVRALKLQFNSVRYKVQKKVRKVKTDYFKNKMEEIKKNPKKLCNHFKHLGCSGKRMNV